jgi:hypothetical protein
MTEKHVDAARWMIEHRIAAGAAHIDPATLRETHDFLRASVSGDSVSVPRSEIASLCRALVDHLPYSPALHEMAEKIERRWLPSAEAKR